MTGTVINGIGILPAGTGHSGYTLFSTIREEQQ